RPRRRPAMGPRWREAGAVHRRSDPARADRTAPVHASRPCPGRGSLSFQDPGEACEGVALTVAVGLADTRSHEEAPPECRGPLAPLGSNHDPNALDLVVPVAPQVP